MKIKLFSLLLALLTLLGALSVTAFANGDGDAAGDPPAGEPLSGKAATDYYSSFYAEGAKAILVAYNAEEDGTVTLSGGGGTWENLVDGEKYILTGTQTAYSVGGTDYTTGWQLSGGAAGYDMPFSLIKKGKAEDAHRITLPAALVGDGHTSTVEVVATIKPIKVDADTTGYKDVDNSGSLTDGDQFSVYNLFFGGRNYALLHIYEDNYQSGMNEVLTKESYIAYNETGRWQGQGGNGGLGSRGYNGKPLYFVVTETLTEDGTVTVTSGYRYDGDSPINTIVNTKRTAYENGASTLSFLENTPCDVYAIRVYDRVLSESELLQNHFVDLAFYFRADLSALDGMDAAARKLALAQLGGLAANLTFETATREELEALVDKVSFDLDERAKTERYASLYVEGATAILMAYNANNNDGTVVLSKGAGTWVNLVNGEAYTVSGSEVAYTVNGEPITAGWHLNGDGSIGYRTSFQLVKGGKNNHEILLPSSLLGDKFNSTVEVVSRYYPLDLADSGREAYADGQTLTQLSVSFGGKNFVGLHIYENAYSGALAAISTKATYLDYNTSGRWQHNNRAGLSTAERDGEPMRLVVRDEVGEGNTVRVSAGYYADGKTALTNAKLEVAVPTASAASMTVMQNVASDVYAIRTYDRCLSAEELWQNHFADLCAYHQLDIDSFIDYVPEEIKQKLYEQWSGFTFTSHTKEQLQRLLDEAFAMRFLSFDGISVKTEGKDNELAAIFSTNEATIAEYVENGYTVEYGILMSKKGEINSLGELLYGLDGIRSVKLYGSDGSGERKYVKETDGSKTFGYSVFFDECTRPSELAAEYFFRAYILLESPEGERTTAYVSGTSGKLGEETSLFEVARYLNKSVSAYAFNEKLTVLVENIYTPHDFYLDSVNGNDENDGRSESSAFKTIEAAFAAFVEFINANPGTPVKLNLHFAKGDVRLTEAVTLYGDEILGDLYKINFIGHADGSSTVNGTVEVSGSEFVEYENGIYAYPLPDHLMGEQFRALYVNGKSAELAHTDWYIAKRNEYGFEDSETGELYWVIYVAPEALAGIVEKATDPATGEEYWRYCDGVDDTSVEWFCRMQWYLANIRAVGVDFEHSDTTITGRSHRTMMFENKNCKGYIAIRLHKDDGENYRTNHTSVGDLDRVGNAKGEFSYRLANHYAFLDAENEFYYDEEQGILYYIPRAGESIESLTFEIPLCEELIVMENLSNVSFENLTFYGTGSNHMTEHGHMSGQGASLKKTNVNREKGWNDDAALVGRNISWLTVKNCNFIGLEYHGIYLAQEISNIEITGCQFDEIGASAVAAPTTVKMVSVTNNYLHNIADTYNNANALYFMKAYELDILYNSIVNCAYSAVSVGWTWNWDRQAPLDSINIDYVEVAYNYIENYMYFMYDGGAVYFNGGSADIGYDFLYNSIHDNYAYIGSREGHVTCPKTSTCWYIDGGGSHTYIYDNVVWVDTDALSMHSYISYQGPDHWNYNYDEPGQQAYRVTSEDNYFINLLQPYLTIGIGRNKALFYLYEINSVLFTARDPYEAALELEEVYLAGGKNEHGETMKEFMLIDPDAYEPVASDMTEAMNVYGIIAGAGCEADTDRPLARADAIDLLNFYQTRVDNYKDEENDKSMRDPRYVDGDNVRDKDYFH